MNAGGEPGGARRWLAPLAVGALLVASVVVALLVWSAERREAERANEALARQVAAVSQRTVELTAASVRGGEGVLRRSGPMPERGFRRYARDVISETPFPALEWAPRVAARERRAFERALGRAIAEPRAPTERHPEGDLRPAPRRNGAYLPIRLVHPDEREQRQFLGLDLLSEPARAMAVRAARESGRQMITTPLFPPDESDPVLIVFNPVYEPGSPLRNESQRRLALRGVLSGAIGAGAIREEITDQIGAMEIAISDGEMPLVASPAAAEGGESVGVAVLGRAWDVWVQDVERASILPALAVGAVGVTLAALVAALFALAGRRELVLSGQRDVAAAEAEMQGATSRTLQQALLPPSLPEIAGFETAAIYRAGADGLEVGGDFYDLFESGGGWTAVIGDVCGKGAEAASLTALVRHTVRAVADRGPAAATREVDRAIQREHRPGTFATLCIASLVRSGAGAELSIVVAGHPPPIVARANGDVELMQPTAPLVGVIEDIEVGETRLSLAPGETFFLYTDGLIEVRDQWGRVFGEDRLREAIRDAAGADLEEMIGAVLARAQEFSPSFPQDDVAILAIRPTP